MPTTINRGPIHFSHFASIFLYLCQFAVTLCDVCYSPGRMAWSNFRVGTKHNLCNIIRNATILSPNEHKQETIFMENIKRNIFGSLGILFGFNCKKDARNSFKCHANDEWMNEKMFHKRATTKQAIENWKWNEPKDDVCIEWEEWRKNRHFKSTTKSKPHFLCALKYNFNFSSLFLLLLLLRFPLSIETGFWNSGRKIRTKEKKNSVIRQNIANCVRSEGLNCIRI